MENKNNEIIKIETITTTKSANFLSNNWLENIIDYLKRNTKLNKIFEIYSKRKKNGSNKMWSTLMMINVTLMYFQSQSNVYLKNDKLDIIYLVKRRKAL